MLKPQPLLFSKWKINLVKADSASLNSTLNTPNMTTRSKALPHIGIDTPKRFAFKSGTFGKSSIAKAYKNLGPKHADCYWWFAFNAGTQRTRMILYFQGI